MLRMSSQVETIVNAYKTLSKIPSIVSGKLNNAGNKVTSKWSVRNLDKGKQTKYLYSYVLDDKLSVVTESDFGTDVSNELLSSISPRETYRAVIKEEKEKETKKQYLEVWKANTLAHCIDLTALDIHGDVYADSEFGSLDWSHDESTIVYVAEKKLPKFEPYIKRKGNKDEDKAGGENQPKKGEEFVYRQDWGEQLVGKHMSVAVICRLDTETCTVLECDRPTWAKGQVRFCSNGEDIVGVAWETEPRRLGLIFCTNRPSFIFRLSLDGKLEKLSAPGMAVRSPRVSVNGDIVWLQRQADGPHHACHQLVVLKRDAKQVSTIIDTVQTEMKIENGVFHGIYSLALPEKCFSNDATRVVFSTPQANEVRSYVADIDGGRIMDISNKTFPGSTVILDVKSDTILSSYTNMTTPGQLHVARLPEKGKESDIKWFRISESTLAPSSISQATFEYLELKHENSQDAVNSFTALYFSPNVDKKVPLIVWPHGGPHSGFVNAFSLEAALFNMLGFASLQINYRGSTGSGQASVDFLPSRVGDTDVKDCKLATEIALRKLQIDGQKLCLFGGSHGGFLVTHLSGQYPDLYRVVVTRNPVIDVASMANTTDIPDWCAVEAGLQFTEQGPVSEEQLLILRRCSPLIHVHKVKAPTALMLGSGDKRVPYYQGLEYARRLKANGVPTKVYMYDDNHSLSSLPSEMDNLINSAKWFLEHLEA